MRERDRARRGRYGTKGAVIRFRLGPGPKGTDETKNQEPRTKNALEVYLRKHRVPEGQAMTWLYQNHHSPPEFTVTVFASEMSARDAARAVELVSAYLKGKRRGKYEG